MALGGALGLGLGARIHIQIYIYTYPLSIYLSVYLSIYAYIYICICIYIYIQTYIHTNERERETLGTWLGRTHPMPWDTTPGRDVDYQHTHPQRDEEGEEGREKGWSWGRGWVARTPSRGTPPQAGTWITSTRTPRETRKGKEKGVRERAGEGSENKVTKGRDKRTPLICFFHASEKAKTKLP